jgi:hypothetical protein
VKRGIWAVAVAVLAVVVATIWIGAKVREDTVVANPYEEGLKLTRAKGAVDGCDLGASPCSAPLADGRRLTLALGPRPVRTMTDLAVTLELAAAPGQPEPSEVSVWFSMVGMQMGENRARLARTAPGRWEGKAVLVTCPSGSRAWLADVEVGSPGAAAGTARFALMVAE